MGKEIRIQKWKGDRLWKGFHIKYPEVTDENCEMIIFNITMEFSTVLRVFPKSDDLKSVLQYILGNGSWNERYAEPGLDFAIKVLYAIVNSNRLNTIIGGKSENVCENNEKEGMVEGEVDKYYLTNAEIRCRLNGMSIQMPKCREDLNKVGQFLREKIEEKIDMIDTFLNMDDDDNPDENTTMEGVQKYFSTRETVKRIPNLTDSTSWEKENRDPRRHTKCVRFSADVK